VPSRLDSIPDCFRSRLLDVHGASPRAQYCFIPFHSSIRSSWKCVPDVKATPTFHNSNSRKITILVALARVVGVRDWLTSARCDLSGSHSTLGLFEIDYLQQRLIVEILVALARLRGCSRSTTFHQYSIVVILVALVRLWDYHFPLPLG
jgi:hypothetical protein